MLRRLRRSLAAGVPALSLGGLLVFALPAPAQTLQGGRTAIAFEARILDDLGIALEDVATSASADRPGALGFALETSASRVRFAPGPDFERFDEASLRHAGGFALRVGGRVLSFAGVQLEAAPAPHWLRLVDAGGQAWLVVGLPHARLSAEADALVIENADLLVTPELAALLGRAELAGSYLGVLETTLELEPVSGPAARAAGGCSPDLGGPVDVELTALSSLTQAAREPGGRVAIAPAAELVNLGPGDVAWNRAILPDTPVGPHPYLVLHLYRLANGVLEQIGRSDLKHAFFATNTGCPCAGGHVLFAGCADLYGVNTNLNQVHLAPRDEIDAVQRSWTSLGSHFDAVPVDDFRDHFGAADHDAFEHRLAVQEPDLQTPGARYFAEAWYLAPNDTSLLNSLGHREVAPSFAGSTWAFPNVDLLELGSILDVWVDPVSPGPGEQSVLVDTGQGRVQLAVTTTAIGGLHHYEWALLNFDYESQLRTFSVPLLPSMSVANVGFGDGDGDPGNDWAVVVGSDHVTWSAPPGSGLDWGRLHSFRMDVDAAPVTSEARMLPLGPGTLVAVPTLAPAAVAAVPALPWPLLAPALALAALLALWGGARRRAPRPAGPQGPPRP